MHLTVVLNKALSSVSKNVSKNGGRDVDIAERAARQNLWLWPLSQYYVADPARSGFVLGFGSTDVADPSSRSQIAKSDDYEVTRICTRRCDTRLRSFTAYLPVGNCCRK